MITAKEAKERAEAIKIKALKDAETNYIPSLRPSIPSIHMFFKGNRTYTEKAFVHCQTT